MTQCYCVKVFKAKCPILISCIQMNNANTYTNTVELKLRTSHVLKYSNKSRCHSFSGGLYCALISNQVQERIKEFNAQYKYQNIKIILAINFYLWMTLVTIRCLLISLVI